MEELEILIEAPGWEALALAPLAEAAILATLEHLGLPPEKCSLSLLACDDARIATLNADFRGKPQPTNVLSWPAEERGAAEEGQAPALPEADAFGEIALGDMALAWETCAREAGAAGRPLEAHLSHLIVHGTLHLLGYDHIRDGDAALMEGLEVEILGKMGLDDPYRMD